jgi:predicted ATPase/DNA-binding SARP family transcriptional activator
MAGSLERMERPAPLPEDASAGASRLPVQLTRFVGRAAELARARELLEGTRLLTLTGPGGSGKTRLALEIAREAESDPGIDVWWVELAGLAEPGLIAQEVASTLRLVEDPGRPVLRTLVESIGSRRVLLVLDNCEHLVDACAVLGDALLRSCPGLVVLASSREALGIAGETAWLVPPLSLPSLAEPLTSDLPERSEAVALFLDRARAVHPGFEISEANALAVAGICRRLDGIPLAIELAAARVRVLTPAQILERLDDCFSLLVKHGRTTLPRHQTIRAAIDWSYRLLLPRKRLLLQRLSVFSGGFTLEAAEAVCSGGEIGAGEVLDLVAALVERSLVVVRERGGNARYHLLEVVRQYAAEGLAARGADAVRELSRRHAAFFAALAEDVGPRLDVLDAPELLSVVAAEHDNLRAALDWAVHAGAVDAALRIAGGVWPFWVHETHWSDGHEWLIRVLDLARTEPSNPFLGRVLTGAGALAIAQAEPQRGRAWMEAAERFWTERSDDRHLAYVYENFAQLHVHLGDMEAALSSAEASVRHARASGDPGMLVFTLATSLGFVHAFRGEAAAADRYCAEAQGIALREGHAWGIMVSSFSRAMTALMHGNVEVAAGHGRSCLEAARRVDSPWFGPRMLLVPAAVALHRGESAAAARLLGCCAELQARALGGRLLAVEEPYFDRLVQGAREGLDPDVFSRAWEEGAALRLDRALAVAAAAVGDPVSRPDVPRPRPDPPSLPPPAGGGEAVAPERRVPAGEAALPAGPELRVRALGALEIVRGQELLSAEHWSYAKPRELLLYLLCRRGGATKDEIGQAIWPDATPSQVRNNLHVTLHYLRKALGSPDWVVFAEERYRIGPNRSAELDLDRFEAEATAVLADPDGAGEARLRDALALYGGDFLESEGFGGWHLEWRDRALARYVELLSILAQRCFDRQDLAEAKRLYQQLVLREALREDLHRRLMQCLARTGERVQALRHGERLIELLREEVAAEPERETADLCERLRRAEPV